MAKITQQSNYRQQAETFCNYIVRQAPRTPKGLVFLDQWGALRHAGNVAFVCLQVRRRLLTNKIIIRIVFFFFYLFFRLLKLVLIPKNMWILHSNKSITY